MIFEMQIDVEPVYPARAVHYLAELYAGQLEAGDDYAKLRPAIGIHFVDGVLFPDVAEYHQEF